MKKYAILAFLLLLSFSAFAREAEAPDYSAYIRSSYALSSGDMKSAAGFFDQVLQHDQSDLALLRRGYLIMSMVGDIRTSAKYARMDKGKDKIPLSDLIVSVDEAMKGDYRAAIASLGRLSLQNRQAVVSSLFEAWYIMGETKDHKAALEKLVPLRSEPQLQSIYHLHVAMINELAGQKEEALVNYELALSDVDKISAKGVQIAASALRRAGMSEVVEKALENVSKERFVVFLYDYLNYVRDDSIPSSLRGASDGLSEAFYNLGSLFLQLRNPETAMLFYNFSLAMDEDFNAARIVLNELINDSDSYEGGEHLYRKFNFNTPFGLTAMIYKVNILKKQGDYEKALKMLKFLSRKYENVPAVQLEYANALRENKQYAKAIPYYDRIIASLPQDDDMKSYKKNWFLFFYRGIAYERTNRWDLAEKDLQFCLELSPNNPYVQNYLGYTWLVSGHRKDEAFSMIEQAVQKLSYDGNILDSLGWAYYLRGKYDKAVSVMEKAVEKSPNNSVILDHLGDSYWKVGRKLEAEFQWIRALQMDQDLEPGDTQKIKFKLENGLDVFETDYKKE